MGPRPAKIRTPVPLSPEPAPPPLRMPGRRQSVPPVQVLVQDLFSCSIPCPCGFYGDPAKECTCSPSGVSRYQRRISGPLLDRIDLFFVEVPRVEYEKLVTPTPAESSAVIRERTEQARQLQRNRFAGTDRITNAEMGPVEVWNFCKTDDASQALLQTAMKQMHLSARGLHRILKLARTIADLAEAETIGIAHLAEALQSRPTGWG